MRGRLRAALAISRVPMKTNVYVDGFNLYYRCLRGTPYKWLDVSAVCRRVFPTHQIHRIRYFTARVRGTENDPQKPQRQATYIRALKTIPNLFVHYGRFLSHRRRMRLATPPPSGPQSVEVIRTEEKGSDVNLATFLLVDGFQGDYDVAIVVSNDSDLEKPIQLIQEKLGLKVDVLSPSKNPSWKLKEVARWYRRIWPSTLKACQFPPMLEDENGTFAKPDCW